MMNYKILIIDDDEQDRKGMAVALGKEGFSEISFAENAQDGLTKALTERPDVVVIDVVLKSIDGFDVCTQIRADKTHPSKIIMITGHLDAINATKARVSGADEIIEKVQGFGNIGKTILQVLKVRR